MDTETLVSRLRKQGSCGHGLILIDFTSPFFDPVIIYCGICKTKIVKNENTNTPSVSTRTWFIIYILSFHILSSYFGEDKRYTVNWTCPCSHLYSKVTFFLSCHSRLHINLASFKRSPVLWGHLFFLPQVTS